MINEKRIYQLKVVLQGSRPQIWRRLLIPSDIKLSRLHDVLQIAMGWEDCHLHQFKARGAYYGIPDEDYMPGFGPKTLHEKRYSLEQLLENTKESMIYEYDFGDGWEHKITLEKILPFDGKTKVPICIGGKMNCPPEDCGGIWGYYSMLDIVSDEDHPEHDSMLSWLGEGFDPYYFNPGQINMVLAKLFR